MPIKPELRSYYPIDGPQISRWVRFVLASSDRLWISSRGLPFGIVGLRLRIQRTTATYVGVRLWPHLLRDFLATHLAIEDPEHVRIATGA